MRISFVFDSSGATAIGAIVIEPVDRNGCRLQRVDGKRRDGDRLDALRIEMRSIPSGRVRTDPASAAGSFGARGPLGSLSSVHRVLGTFGPLQTPWTSYLLNPLDRLTPVEPAGPVNRSAFTTTAITIRPRAIGTITNQRASVRAGVAGRRSARGRAGGTPASPPGALRSSVARRRRSACSAAFIPTSPYPRSCRRFLITRRASDTRHLIVPTGASQHRADLLVAVARRPARAAARRAASATARGLLRECRAAAAPGRRPVPATARRPRCPPARTPPRLRSSASTMRRHTLARLRRRLIAWCHAIVSSQVLKLASPRKLSSRR